MTVDSRVGAWVAGWLPDSRRLVLMSGLDASVYDTTTGAICPMTPLDSFSQISLAANGSELVVEHRIMDSSIWLLRFEAK